LDARQAWAINGRYEASRGEDITSVGKLLPRVDGVSLELSLYLIDTIDFRGDIAARETGDGGEPGYRIAESMLTERPSLAETYWSLLEEAEACHGLAYEDKAFSFASTLLATMEEEDGPSIARSFAGFCQEHCPSIYSYLEDHSWRERWSLREPKHYIPFRQRSASSIQGQRFFTSAKGYW
jgi:hypothetical protein